MAGCLLVMGLASCEMKNEILGKEDGSSEMGLLNLGVAVDAKNNDVQTKADANPGTPESIPSVSATDISWRSVTARAFTKPLLTILRMPPWNFR